MKRIFFALACLLFSNFSFSQLNSVAYEELKKKGDSFYKSKSFKEAAINYSQLLRLPGEKLTIWDWDRAAFSWTLTGNADSAFYYLDIIANLDSIRCSDYVDVVDDRDFNFIRNEGRWKVFNEMAFQKSRQTFYASQKSSDEKAKLEDRKWLIVAFTYNLQQDSAFYHLNLYAESTALTFTLADDILKEDYLMPLQNDKRWPELKNKMYSNLAIIITRELKNSGAKATNTDRRQAALAYTFSSQTDNAFYQLGQIADSKELSFEDVFFILTDGKFSNISADGTFKALESDKRWTLMKEKLFGNLYKKYFPSSAFAKTKKSGKRLLIDGGHFNLHDIEGTYASLAGPLHYCGIEAFGYKEKFDAASLKSADILLISNPNPDRQDSIARRAQRAKEPVRWSTAATQPGYTNDEVTSIHDWVKNGGSLLLILDHAPNGKVGEALAAAFGIENRNVGTYDPLSRDPAVDSNQAKTILFTRSKSLIGKHPIVEGVDSITTYTGESLIGPPESVVLLHLPETATDQDWLPETNQFRYRSAAGRSQGIAFEYGKGRVVMLGEAAITRPSSLSVSDRGNWKFVLNILRWLAKEEMD